MPKAASHPQHVLSLVSIVHKNLEHQADWSELHIHSTPNLPRPLISGIPSEAIYVDPDTNTVEVRKAQSGKKKKVGLGQSEIADGDEYCRKIDREWVLPVDLREKWTVRQWAEVFDSIPAEPPVPRSADDGPDDEPGGVRLDNSGGSPSLEAGTEKRKKRLVMGMVSGDSTVVYYIVHDGIVKPRQN
ncbi:tRNA-splicing endonuclease subunit Sen15 [Terfezia claveryi]|nr:tRNA-splicing endonuclease subunit Sen15 [Terfezia claveryi]